MKKIFLISVLLIVVFTACASKDTVSLQEAEQILTSHLVSDFGYIENSDYLESGHESTIDETKCYVFDWRSGQEGIKDRLVGSYAVSIEGNSFFHYDAGEDVWVSENLPS